MDLPALFSTFGYALTHAQSHSDTNFRQGHGQIRCSYPEWNRHHGTQIPARPPARPRARPPARAPASPRARAFARLPARARARPPARAPVRPRARATARLPARPRARAPASARARATFGNTQVCLSSLLQKATVFPPRSNSGDNSSQSVVINW